MGLTGWSSANYLKRASQVIDTYPFVLVAWVHSSAYTTTNRNVVSVGQAANINARRAHLRSSVTGNTCAAACYDGATFDEAAGGTAATVSIWQHFAGEFISTTSRARLLNGANRTTNASSINPAASDSVYIGVWDGGGGTGTDVFTNTGGIAEVSIWNGSGMSNANMDSLIAKLWNGGAAGAGGNPLNITAESSQPWTGKLVAYWPLTTIAAGFNDAFSTHHLSMVGTLTNFAGSPTHPVIEAVGGVNTDRTPGTMIKGT